MFDPSLEKYKLVPVVKPIEGATPQKVLPQTIDQPQQPLYFLELSLNENLLPFFILSVTHFNKIHTPRQLTHVQTGMLDVVKAKQLLKIPLQIKDLYDRD